MRRAFLGSLLCLMACEGSILGDRPSIAPTSPNVNPHAETPPCVPSTAGEPVAMRRLTRAEYDNTLRDLLGVTQTSGDALPQDERTGLFLSNVSGSVSWSMLEQYGISAETLTDDVGRMRASVDACDTQASGETTCAERFVDQFGRRAFRRALSIEERDRYRALYAAHRARGTFDDGIRMVARTMLQSPNFLYHFDEKLAARLAFFAWNAAPDDELLAADLSSQATLEAQIDRLLADDRARSAIGDFHLQLLGVDGATTPNKSPTLYPGFDGAAWRSMVGDAARFADHVVRRGDGTLRTLLTASYAVNAQNQVVTLEPSQRVGLLTFPAVLAGLANPDTTSPVRRGRMIRRNLMCQALPDPPPNAPTTVPPATGQETTRQRVTRVTSQAPGCAACHQFINDVGFGFEHYGPLGEWQTQDNGLAIDATGTLTGTEQSNGTFDGARELSTRLAGSKEVQQCYTKQWVRFALGRAEQPRDDCEVQQLSADFAAAGGDIKFLLRRIALSRALAYENPRVPVQPTGGGSGAGGGGGSTGGGGGGATGGGGGGATGGGGGTTDAGTAALTVLLAVNATIAPDGSVDSAGGTHHLVYQLDGNLVLYRATGGPAFATGTQGTTPGFVAMQGDGNLVIYNAATMPVFSTRTGGNPGAQLYFEAGGRLHVIATDGTKLWSSP